MMRAAAVVLMGVAPVASAQHHEAHPSPPSREHRAEVEHRHAGATSVGHEASEHHFLLGPHGGSIRLEVTDPADLAGRDRIREHLQQIARAFEAGDFSMPMRIHDEAPPGVDVMAARRSAIRYSYTATDRGGSVTIATEDAAARDAIHRFLRFQIVDHGTGDPTG